MAISKEEGKERIAKLVEQFRKDLESGKAKRYKEEETKTRYIQPFFEALGWDFSAASDEFTMEENISKKRVDYGFRINGIPKFFVEAKRVKENLNNRKFIEQALDYSWHKGCTWAVLTDFEGLKVFNAEYKSKNIFQNLFFGLSWENYLNPDSFDRIWMLSRESMEKGIMDKEAEKWGKKIKKGAVKKKPVMKQLLDDLLYWRKKLRNNIKKNNKNLSEYELGETIQRIIDRLIFIKTCEDRGIESNRLVELYRTFDSKRRINVKRELNKIYEYYNATYNSKLFARHLCEDVKIDDKVVVEVIKGLDKTRDNSINYDFSAIDADVLGSIYEQYLGHVISKKGDSKGKRKQQGIYYTPSYIVDYIVKNTVGEYIKGKRKDTVKNIKILDPACGSGSFLLRAFDELDGYWKRNLKDAYKQTKLGGETPITKKIEILKNNIYGVDLDEKATEIARLNLLLKAAEKRHLLPALDKNIRIGNSLIDSEEVAGERAFNWEEKFPDIIQYDKTGNLKKDYGFDIVIGNPPYVRPHNLDEDTKRHLWKRSKVMKAKGDLYAAFIEKGIELLQEKGIISFIVPHTWLFLESFEDLREYVLDTTKIKSITLAPRKVFQDATVETLVFVFEKCDSENLRKKNDIKIRRITDTRKIEDIGKKKQEDYYSNRIFEINVGEDSKVLSKIEQNTKKLKENVEFFYGLKTADDKKFLTFDPKNKIEYKKLLRRRNIDRYSTNFKGEYVYYRPDLMKKNKKTARPGEPSRFEGAKIVIMDIAKKLVCTYDDENYFIKDALILKEKNENVDLKYLVTLINSRLLNYYYKQKYKVLSVAKNAFLELPIKIVPRSQQESFISLVNKMLSLNRHINKIEGKQTDEKIRLEKEIEKTDKQIDELVYKIYRITEKEKKIIEESLK
ncbi:N-6 DNA methylase [Candidatus Micrarchaeota archaeon]|nr:N-6 DNA methylase [Candidatus Micrarchaeota archaeon]